MKKFFLSLVLAINLFQARADEGMWLPLLLKAMNEKEMKKMGCKLSADEIYNVNKTSLKDTSAEPYKEFTCLSEKS